MVLKAVTVPKLLSTPASTPSNTDIPGEPAPAPIRSQFIEQEVESNSDRDAGLRRVSFYILSLETMVPDRQGLLTSSSPASCVGGVGVASGRYSIQLPRCDEPHTASCSESLTV